MSSFISLLGGITPELQARIAAKSFEELQANHLDFAQCLGGLANSVAVVDTIHPNESIAGKVSEVLDAYPLAGVTVIPANVKTMQHNALYGDPWVFYGPFSNNLVRGLASMTSAKCAVWYTNSMAAHFNNDLGVEVPERLDPAIALKELYLFLSRAVFSGGVVTRSLDEYQEAGSVYVRDAKKHDLPAELDQWSMLPPDVARALGVPLNARVLVWSKSRYLPKNMPHGDDQPFGELIVPAKPSEWNAWYCKLVPERICRVTHQAGADTLAI